jgi:hypothetical protein
MATSRKTTPAVKTIVKQVAGAAEKTAALAHKAERVAVKTAAKAAAHKPAAPAKKPQAFAKSVTITPAKTTVAATTAKKTAATPAKTSAPSRAAVKAAPARTGKPAVKVTASKLAAKTAPAKKASRVSSRVTLHHGDGSDTTFEGNHQVTHVKASQVVRGEAATLAAAGLTGTPALASPVNPKLPHGIDKLAAETADNKTLMTPMPVVRTNGERAPDGQPATAENIGPATSYNGRKQTDWRQSGTGFTRSAPLPPGTKLTTEPSIPADQPSPALLERRFEVYPDGLGAYSWRLVIAATGAEVAVSKSSFGTPSVAEENAKNEARFYQPGTVTVVRLSHNPRGSR